MSGRGLPSWYKYRAYGPVYEEIRLAEHAVRLGSPVSFDRRGDVIFIDDFGSGLQKWRNYNYGTGAAVALSVDVARSGVFSCKRTTGSDGDRATLLQREFPYPVLSKIGYEKSFTLSPYTERVRMDLWLYGETEGIYPRVIYDYATGKLYYYDETYTERELGAAPNRYTDPVCFHIMKVVVDFVNKKYHRLVFDEQGYDMSDLGVFSGGAPLAPCLRLNSWISGVSGRNVVTYIDDVIVTQNEP